MSDKNKPHPLDLTDKRIYYKIQNDRLKEAIELLRNDPRFKPKEEEKA